MMDDKKIEDAAKQHSEESYISDYFQACYKDAFKAGAKWAINEFLKNLWHPASEEPNIKQGECCVTCLALKYWKEAVDATEETITLSNGLGYNGYEKTSIFMFISFKELKDMAIERLTMSLEQHQKMYEEL